MTAWHSAFARSEDPARLTAALLAILIDQGYNRFDPFPGGSGTPIAYKQFVKLFIGPAQAGWIRVIGAPDLIALAALSREASLLYGWLTDNDSGWRVFADGEAHDEAIAFTPYLKPNLSPEAFTRAQSGQVSIAADEAGNPTLVPPDIQQLARERGVNPKQAERMTERVTAQLFGRLDRSGQGADSGTMRGQAQALLSGGGEWNRPAGQRLRAMAATLTLPDNWRTPEIEALREAFSLTRRLARNPKATLLLAERDAIRAVPDAAQYEALYVGKS